MQENSAPKPPQSSYLLRLLGGGYLVYLGYDIGKDTLGLNWLTAAAAVFILVGGALFITSAITLARSDYFYNRPEENKTKDEE